MAGIRLGWWVRLGLAGCAVGLLAMNWAVRREPRPPVSSDSLVTAGADGPDGAGESVLVNDAWRVRSMATTDAAFVIEVEVAVEAEAEGPTQIETIARALVEPIQDRYDEIRVHLYVLDDDSGLPARRMQWTPAGGYVEIAADQPEPDR